MVKNNRNASYSARAAAATMIFVAPAERITCAHEFVVAPVVMTSSTKRHFFPNRMSDECGISSNACSMFLRRSSMLSSRLRLGAAYSPHCICNNRLVNDESNTACNEFGLIITTLAVLYAMKWYRNKNINFKTPFFQCFSNMRSQIQTNRLILLIFQCMCNMLKRSFLLEGKTRNKITNIAVGKKFHAHFLIEREMFCYQRNCIPTVNADFLASIQQRFIAGNAHRRIEEVEECPCECCNVQ